jgi:hypothetical protein
MGSADPTPTPTPTKPVPCEAQAQPDEKPRAPSPAPVPVRGSNGSNARGKSPKKDAVAAREPEASERAGGPPVLEGRPRGRSGQPEAANPADPDPGVVKLENKDPGLCEEPAPASSQPKGRKRDRERAEKARKKSELAQKELKERQDCEREERERGEREPSESAVALQATAAAAVAASPSLPGLEAADAKTAGGESDESLRSPLSPLSPVSSKKRSKSALDAVRTLLATTLSPTLTQPCGPRRREKPGSDPRPGAHPKSQEALSSKVDSAERRGRARASGPNLQTASGRPGPAAAREQAGLGEKGGKREGKKGPDFGEADAGPGTPQTKLTPPAPSKRRRERTADKGEGRRGSKKARLEAQARIDGEIERSAKGVCV